jgi:uncharacterized membrane protein YkoI
MKNLTRITAVTALAAIVPAFVGAATLDRKLVARARVTPQQAQTIALKARPGKIVDAEIEREGGGSGLRYSFDVAYGGATYEVGVDANTGVVLENAREGKAD